MFSSIYRWIFPHKTSEFWGNWEKRHSHRIHVCHTPNVSIYTIHGSYGIDGNPRISQLQSSLLRRRLAMSPTPWLAWLRSRHVLLHRGINSNVSSFISTQMVKLGVVYGFGETTWVYRIYRRSTPFFTPKLLVVHPISPATMLLNFKKLSLTYTIPSNWGASGPRREAIRRYGGFHTWAPNGWFISWKI